MGGYTKGPWRLIDNGPHWNNPNITNYKIAWSDAGELVCEHVYEQADARLIAAAPTLLEAAQRVTAAFRSLGESRSLIADFELHRECEAAMLELDAAISRATGEGV